MPVGFKRSLRLVMALLPGLLVTVTIAPAAGQQADKLAPCHEIRPTPQTDGSAARIRLADDGQLEVSGGTRLRLADVQSADRLPDMSDSIRATLRSARKNMLSSLISARILVACSHSDNPDRYGRLFVDAVDSGEPFSLRRHLVAEGLALVFPRTRADTCCARLYRAEALARREKKGVWATTTKLIRTIDRRTGTTTLPASDFAIVEGRVLSVGDRERELYLNFGHRWTNDFTVTVVKSNFAGTEVDLARMADLAGKRIRVRGVSDAWQGGRIRVTDPDQIEILTP